MRTLVPGIWRDKLVGARGALVERAWARPRLSVAGARRSSSYGVWIEERAHERVVTREPVVGSRNVAPPVDLELQAERVAMRLDGSSRDTELASDLFVRAAGGYESDYLPLPARDRRRRRRGRVY